jgi:hypothetical protein
MGCLRFAGYRIAAETARTALENSVRDNREDIGKHCFESCIKVCLKIAVFSWHFSKRVICCIVTHITTVICVLYTAEKFRSDLCNIAMTTLSSKILSQDKEHFANLAVDAVLRLKVHLLGYLYPGCDVVLWSFWGSSVCPCSELSMQQGFFIYLPDPPLLDCCTKVK